MFCILVRSVGLAKKVERRRSNDAPQKSVVIFLLLHPSRDGGELVLFQGACVHAVFPGTARDLLSKSGKCGQAGPFGESAHGVTVRVPQGDDMCVAEKDFQWTFFIRHKISRRIWDNKIIQLKTNVVPCQPRCNI